MGRSAIAAVFHGPGQPLRAQRFDAPDPVGAGALVRVTGCTLCGSDLHTFDGRRSAPTPSVLGHEIVGRIEALGPDAPRCDAVGQPLRPGDRVTWSVVAHCGRCFYCTRRLPQKCEAMVKYGHEALRPGAELTGGLAEFCQLAPGSTVFRLPDGLSDAVACPASCATATVAAALRAAGSVAGGTVLVQGAGLLGLTACAMARHLGAAEVVCCDVAPARLALAEAFGATRTAPPADLATAVAAATGRYGVDVALELTGSPDAFDAGLSLIRTGGTYVLVGAVYPGRPVSIGMEAVVRRQLTLRGVHNYAPEDLSAALRFLVEADKYPFASLVGDWVPLADANRAFEAAGRGGALRIGVRASD